MKNLVPVKTEINSIKQISTKVSAYFLLLILFTNSLPAAPQITLAVFKQTSTRLTILYGGDNLIETARQYFFKPQPIKETQELRESEVVRLEVKIPEKAYIGQQIQLGAIPYDKNNITVSGINLSWETEDGEGKIQTITNEQFTPEKLGEYKITVKGADKQQTSIIIIEEPSQTVTTTSVLLPYQEWNSDNIEMARDIRN